MKFKTGKVRTLTCIQNLNNIDTVWQQNYQTFHNTIIQHMWHHSIDTQYHIGRHNMFWVEYHPPPCQYFPIRATSTEVGQHPPPHIHPAPAPTLGPRLVLESIHTTNKTIYIQDMTWHPPTSQYFRITATGPVGSVLRLYKNNIPSTTWRSWNIEESGLVDHHLLH